MHLGIPIYGIDEYRRCYYQGHSPSYGEELAWYRLFQDVQSVPEAIIESSGLSWRIQSFVKKHGNIPTVILLADKEILLERLASRKKEEVPFLYSANLTEEGLIDHALKNIREVYPSAPVVDTGQTKEGAFTALRQTVVEVGGSPQMGESLGNRRSSNHRLVDPSKLDKELNMANFTDITIKPLNKGKLRGSGQFIYNGAMEIKFTVVEGSKGLFVSLPRRQYEDAEGNTKYANEVFIVDQGVRNEMQEVVLAEYNKNGANAPENENQDAGNDGIPF